MNETERDRRIRGHMIASLGNALSYAPENGLSGSSLLSHANSLMLDDQQIETISDAIRVIRELESAGYVVIRYTGRRPSEVLSLKHFGLVTITARGLRLWRGEISPDPMVWQDRID